MCIVLGTANRLSIQGNVLELLLHMVHEDLRERVVGIFAAGHDVHAAGLRLALYTETFCVRNATPTPISTMVRREMAELVYTLLPGSIP